MANCLDENYQQQRRDARGREITARLLGRLLRHDIPLEIAEVTWEGDVIYRIPYSELKLQQSEIMIMPFVAESIYSFDWELARVTGCLWRPLVRTDCREGAT